MPHIIVKRTDIPEGVLQVLDLKPNTSQRSLIYDPPPQSKYLSGVPRNAVTLNTNAGVVTVSPEVRGVEAWMITNVDNATVVQATATVTPGTPLALDTVTIGGQALVGVAGARTPGLNDFNVGAANIADEIAAAINDAGNGFALIATATSDTVEVTLEAVPLGVLGNAVTLATSTVELVISGALFTLGSDGGAMTNAQAVANADAVLALLGHGSLTVAPVAVNLAGINGAMITGALTGGQVAAFLAVVEGQEYVVPAGTVVSTDGIFGVSPAVGATGGPGFSSGTFRPTYSTDSLAISFGLGVLSKLKATDFEYRGVTGAQGMAVVVLNDDGTLYT